MFMYPFDYAEDNRHATMFQADNLFTCVLIVLPLCAKPQSPSHRRKFTLLSQVAD